VGEKRGTSAPAVITGSKTSPIIQLENQIILPGQIGLANESRFNTAFFSEPLTEYASGWREPNDLEAILDFLAPPVQVGRRFEYKRADNAEAFLLDADDARTIGADFKRVEYRGSSVNDKTLNRGLTMRIDLDAVGDMPDWRELFTERLLQRLLRSEFKRAVDLIVNNATNTAKTWDTSAGKDPDQDVMNDSCSVAIPRVFARIASCLETQRGTNAWSHTALKPPPAASVRLGSPRMNLPPC